MEYHYQLTLTSSAAYKELQQKYREVKETQRKEKEEKLKVFRCISVDFETKGRRIAKVYQVTEKAGRLTGKIVPEKIINMLVYQPSQIKKTTNPPTTTAPYLFPLLSTIISSCRR